MEEVDAIIIDSLKHLNCPIDEDVSSLKQFDHDLIVRSIITCINNITPDVNFPYVLPASMSQRLKFATTITDHIKEIGFRGDIGYQTILYYNEVEARRLLMFLIERLPRETDKTVHSNQTERSSNLVTDIKASLRSSLKSVWLPSEIRQQNIKSFDKSYFNFGNTYPLKTTTLQTVNSSANLSQEFTQYSARYMPSVTKQCSYKTLLPSLLFAENVELEPSSLSALSKYAEPAESWDDTCTDIKLSYLEKEIQKEPSHLDIKNVQTDSNSTINLIETLSNEINEKKQAITSVKNELKTLENKKTQINETTQSKKTDLDSLQQQIAIKSKINTLLTNNDNISKLKSVIDTGSKKLMDLTNQWYEVQKPLLNKYRFLQKNLCMNESEVSNLATTLNKLHLNTQKAKQELNDKKILYAQLNEQINNISKQTNRSAYTRRIMEIISNIKKQSTDINKILEDTRAIQKEINTINGQLERSFTLTDEVIFRDARHDETARKAYKLLALMHSEYEQVIQIITELGSVVRETRNLQEQVDNEESREINTRLERVLSDLEQIKNETALLMNKQ